MNESKTLVAVGYGGFSECDEHGVCINGNIGYNRNEIARGIAS